MSTQTKHTPGPWTVPHFALPDVDCECAYVLCDEFFGAICSVHCSGEGNDFIKNGDNPKFEEACANARLIAAAPKLLEALLDVRNRIAQSEEWWIDAPERGGFDVAAIDAVITAATGGAA